MSIRPASQFEVCLLRVAGKHTPTWQSDSDTPTHCQACHQPYPCPTLKVVLRARELAAQALAAAASGTSLGTSGGVELTEELIEKLVNEVVAGDFDLDRLRPPGKADQ